MTLLIPLRPPNDHSTPLYLSSHFTSTVNNTIIFFWFSADLLQDELTKDEDCVRDIVYLCLAGLKQARNLVCCFLISLLFLQTPLVTDTIPTGERRVLAYISPKLYSRGKDSVLKLQLKHQFAHLSHPHAEFFVAHEGFYFVYRPNTLTIKSKGLFFNRME